MVGTVIAELYTALSGLGYLIAQFGGTFQTAKYFAPVLVLSAWDAAQPVAEDCRAAARALEIHAGRALIGLCMGVSVLVSGCEVAPPPTITPPPSTPRSIPTLEGTRPLAVAVPVGTPTPTVPIVGDYSTLVRDRLVRVESAFQALDAQFAVLQTAPIRITQADWRNDTLARLDDLAATNDALRALGARSGADGLLYGEVSKVSSDLDFVVSEYRMAFDFDPDGESPGARGAG